jgi:hypothetical protein
MAEELASHSAVPKMKRSKQLSATPHAKLVITVMVQFVGRFALLISTIAALYAQTAQMYAPIK